MKNDFLKTKTILITGGTGSFGKNFAAHLLKNYSLKKLIVFSRDELKQSQMSEELKDERLRFFLGDVRDLPRLQRAFHGVDIVVHAAALKQVPTLEYNPFEAVKTNILGSQNVIEAAIDQEVEKVLLISTDKAVQPINLYGSTKLCAEKLFINGNVYTGGDTKFSCVRYGNVIGSRGSIVDVLLRNGRPKKVQLTDKRMTRFWLTLEQSFELVEFALANMVGGEIFVPKIPSMRLVDVFEAVVPGAKIEIIGIRPGEKIHEVLITQEEAKRTVDLQKCWAILPASHWSTDRQRYEKLLKQGNLMSEEFCFSSENNENWLTKNNLKKIIKKLIK